MVGVINMFKSVNLDPKLCDLTMSRCKTEPVDVAKFSDDLWLGVIGLSNTGIAGSPRNLF